MTPAEKEQRRVEEHERLDSLLDATLSAHLQALHKARDERDMLLAALKALLDITPFSTDEIDREITKQAAKAIAAVEGADHA